MTDEELRVNPLGLRHGFVVHGRIFDDSFGNMTFRRRFNDLAERPILTAKDGTQSIELVSRSTIPPAIHWMSLSWSLSILMRRLFQVRGNVIFRPEPFLRRWRSSSSYYLTGQDPTELIGG